MRLEIVTHCWRYSSVLAYQLASIVRHAPQRVDLSVRVFFTPEDSPTLDVLNQYKSHGFLYPEATPRSRLLRRAFGRQSAALETTADVVWFTDADICFGAGALDSLADVDFSEAPMWRPASILQTNTRQIGDAYAAKSATCMERIVHPRDCYPDKIRRASGAYQIVPGDVCRKHGYITDREVDKQPVVGYEFIGSRSDVRFRNQIAKIYGTHAAGKTIEIPNLIRIRQSIFGHVDIDTPSTSSGYA